MNADVLAASAAFMQAANRLPRLYDLAAEWQPLLAMLEDPEQDPAEVEQLLAHLAGDIKAKAHGVAVVVQSLENLAEMQKGEANRMAAKAKANQSHADRLRAYALTCMQSIPGLERIETGNFVLAIRLNNPSVNVVDPAAVPSDFQRTTISVEVDKRRILSHVKAGGDVPAGTEIVRTERLAIS